MTNQVRGTVTARLGGRSMTMAMTAQAWCVLEAETGLDIGDILTRYFGMARTGDVSLSLVRSVLACALDIDDHEAGELICTMSLSVAVALGGEAMIASLPAPKPDGYKGDRAAEPDVNRLEQAFVGWVAAGLDPASYWRMTPREIDTVMRGVGERRRREHDERAWSVWHTAALTAFHPEKFKDFPPLKRLLSKSAAPKGEGNPDGWKSIFAKVSAWAGRGTKPQEDKSNDGQDNPV